MAERRSPPRVLFLCTGNSCRSQMAEGWCRALHPHSIDAHSAGIRPQGLNAMAVKAMAEVGIDISSQRSKRIDEAGGSFDLLVTVCGDAAESCPSVPGATVIHAGFDDPPRLALSAASEDEAMSHYRRVRDEIRSFIANLPRELEALVARDRPNGARIDMTAVEP